MQILRTVRIRTAAVLAILLLGMALTGCGEDPDPEPGPPPPPPDLADLASLVGLEDDSGTIRVFNDLFGQFVRDFDAGLGVDEGLAMDRLANGYRNGVVGGMGAVRTLCRLPLRDAVTGTSFDPVMTDRSITGGATGLQTPKGSTVARTAGRLIVADNGSGGSDIKVYSTTAGGNVAPLFTQGTSAPPWDVAYDEASDTLFAALTNGDIARFDDFLDTAGGAAETTFRPDNALPASNMHGIAYDAGGDRLVVSDVGDAAIDDDGSIYVFASASTQTGNVAPARIIRGDATRLGNPVDLVLSEQAGNPGVFDLGVAEKANNLLLTFTDIFSGTGEVDEPPASARGQSAPETIALRTPADQDFTANFSTTDLDFDVALNFVFSTDMQTADNVSRMDPALSTAENFFTADFTNTTLQNIVLGLDGDAFISFDDGANGDNDLNGGLAILNRLNLRSGGTDAANRDRIIRGPNANLVAPRGIDVADFFGVVMVADIKSNQAATQGTIQVYSACAAADAAPLFTTTLPIVAGQGVKPWDLDYDPFNDRLFVAATNGTVLVYDDYLERQPDSQAPDRTITPTVNGSPADNLHGIQYVLFGEDGGDVVIVDRLVVSDVGTPGNDADGDILVIFDAGSADGDTEVVRQIKGEAGDPVPLGDPVDIAFDGDRLYVADKANDMIYRIPGIINPANFGKGQPLNPDAQIMRTAPESISPSPSYLP